MLALLPHVGQPPRNSTELTEKFYGTTLEKAPFHGRKIVIGLLASIARKADRHKESFAVKRSRRSGPIPMSFWLEKRNEKIK